MLSQFSGLSGIPNFLCGINSILVFPNIFQTLLLYDLLFEAKTILIITI